MVALVGYLDSRMKIARVGLVIGAGFVLEVVVGGVLVLDALIPDKAILRTVLMLTVLVQVAAFALWIFVSRRTTRGTTRTVSVQRRRAPSESFELRAPIDEQAR